MLHALKLHPDSRCDAVTGIEIDVARFPGGALVVTYYLKGRTADLLLPPVGLPRRTDGLWRHTCFEAFVRATGNEAYAEFNFSPSTAWAAYRFSGYRDGMTIAREVSDVEIDVRATGATFDLQAPMELGALENLPSEGYWRLGLSAVIEETSGRLSYWALAHPPGKADFHHSDCFTLEVAPASDA